MPKLSALLVLFFVIAGVLVPGAASAQPASEPAPDERPTNVILFIADGTGPATITMARDYVREVLGRDALALDEVLVGSVRTYATNSRVTDSAAGATAFSAGVKTYNGAIAMDTLRRPVGTILEAAEDAGLATGLVATSRITHATPAAFSAHVENRGMEAEIAAQQARQGIDVIFGGGRDYFVPADAGGRRADSLDLLAEAEAAGYTLANTRAAFDEVMVGPVLGLFAGDHLAYEIDRDSLDEPSLAEMTAKAIELLDNDPDGFFLMVEGSRIDHAGHANDPAAHLFDMLAYDAAVAVALDYARADGETLVVAVSDHETGGLTLGRNVDGRGVYAWEPAVLSRVRASLGPIVGALIEQAQTPETVLAELAGIEELNEQERAILDAALADNAQLASAVSDIVSRRALVGWTTTGHTAVDVGLYAFGPGAGRFVGHHDNTAVGRTLADLMGFRLEPLTEALRR